LVGHFAEAEAVADRADAEARRIEDVSALHIGDAFRIELLRLSGRIDEAVTLVRTGRERAGAPAVPIFLAVGGLIFAEADQTDDAHRMLDEVRPILTRLPRDGRWSSTVAGAGRLAALLNDTDTAAWCLAQLTPYTGYYLVGGSASVRCEGSIARVTGTLAAALGDTEKARRWLADAIVMDGRIGAMPYRVISQVELARLLAGHPGEHAEAADLARRAAETARRLGMAPAFRAADEIVARLRADRDAHHL
jgi:hypothetical protein